MICSNCGKEVTMYGKFCEKCGNDLTKAGAAKNPATPAPHETPVLTEEQKYESKKCIIGMVLGIISIMLSFSINYFDHLWYITLVYLFVSLIGLGLGITSLIIGVRGKFRKSHLYIPALVLGIVATCICGIKVMVDFNQFIRALSLLNA